MEKPSLLFTPVAPRIVLYLLAFILILMGMTAEMRSLPSTDVVWHLHMAERILAGERLYVDLLEINPPLITGLKLPIVALAGTLHLPSLLLFRIVLFLVLLGIWAWTLRLRAKASDALDAGNGVDALALAVVLFILPFDAFGRLEFIQAFGEREHLMVAGLLPWLATLALRLSGRPVRMRTALLAGVVAGVALALKPQHGLIWAGAAVYIYFFRSRSLKSVVTLPELWMPVALVPVYALGIALWTPQYGAFLKTWSADYMAWHQVSMLQIAGRPVVFVAGTVVLLSLVQAFRRGREPWRDLLALAVVSAVAGYLVQKKDFPYHTYPIVAWSVLLLAALLKAEWTVAEPNRRTGAGQRAAFAVVTAALLAWLVAKPMDSAMGRAMGHDPMRLWISATYKDVPDRVRNRSFVALESQYGLALLLIPYAHARWELGLPLLWPLGSAYHDEFPNARVPTPRLLSERTEVERRVMDVVIRDLAAKRPERILVLQPGGVNWSQFDTLRYFMADPRFRKLLSGYRDTGVHGPYRIFERRTPEGGLTCSPDSGPVEMLGLNRSEERNEIAAILP